MENRSPGGDDAADTAAAAAAAVPATVAATPAVVAAPEAPQGDMMKASTDAVADTSPAPAAAINGPDATVEAPATEPAAVATTAPAPPPGAAVVQPPPEPEPEDVDMEDAEPVALVGSTTPPVVDEEDDAQQQPSSATPPPPGSLDGVLPAASAAAASEKEEEGEAVAAAAAAAAAATTTEAPVVTAADVAADTAAAAAVEPSSAPTPPPPSPPPPPPAEVDTPNIPGTPPPPPAATMAPAFATPARVPHDLKNIIRAAQQSVEKTMMLQGAVPPSPVVEPGALHELGDLHVPGRRRSSATAGIAGLEELRNRMDSKASGFGQMLQATEVKTEQLNEDGQPIIQAFLRIDFADGNVYYVKSPSVVFGRADGSAGVSFQHVGKNGTTIMETGPRGFGRLPAPGEFLDKPEKKKRKKKKKPDSDLRRNKASSSGASSNTPGPGQNFIGFQEPPSFRNPFGHIDTTDDQEEPVIHLPLNSRGENLPIRKNISRRHARLFFNHQKSRFEFEVLGKNGAFVDDEYVQTGTNIVVEQKGLKVQIGGITFSIIVPPGIYATEKSAGGKDPAAFHGGKMSFSFHDEHGNEVQTDAYGSDIAMQDGSDESGDGDSGDQSDEDEAEDDGNSDEEEEDDSEDEIEPSPSPEPVIEKKRGRGRPKNSDLEKARKLKAKEALKEQERQQELERKRKKEKERIEAARREKEKREKEKQKAKEKEEREKKRLAEQRKQEELKEQREKQKAEKKREREKEKMAKKAKKEQPKLYLPTIGGQTKAEATPPPAPASQSPPVPPPKTEPAPAAPAFQPMQQQPNPNNDPATIMAPIPYQDPQQPQAQPQPQPQPQPLGQYAIDPSLFDQQMAPPQQPMQYQVPPKERRPKPPPRKIERTHSPEPQESDYTEDQLMKPTCSYVIMCHDAIKNSPNQMLSLPEIYKAIERKYPYYKFRVSTNGWQSSVRHNLGQNKAFRKVERSGKGWMWGVVDGVSIEKERKGALPKPPMMYNPPMNGMYMGQPNGQMLNPGMGVPQPGYMPQPQGMQPPQSQQYGMATQQVPVPPAYLPRPLPANGVAVPGSNARAMEAPIPHPTGAAVPAGPPEIPEHVKRIITLLSKLIATAKPHAAANAALAGLIAELEKLISSLQSGSPLDKNTTATMNSLVSQVKSHLPSSGASAAAATATAPSSASPAPGATAASPAPATAASASPAPSATAASPPPPAAAPAAAAANPKLQEHMARIKNMTPEEKAALTQRLLALKQKQAAAAAAAAGGGTTQAPAPAPAPVSASAPVPATAAPATATAPDAATPQAQPQPPAGSVAGKSPVPAGKAPAKAVTQISPDIFQQAMQNVNARQQAEGETQNQGQQQQAQKRPAEGPPTEELQPPQKKVDVGPGTTAAV